MAKVEDIAPVGGGRYINAADKAMLAGDHVAMTIQGVKFDGRARYGARWLVTCATLADGELIDVDFADNAARANLFERMSKALDAGETFDPVTLEEITPEDGNANAFWAFVTAAAEYVESPVAATWADDAEAAGAETVPAVEGPRLAKAKK